MAFKLLGIIFFVVGIVFVTFSNKIGSFNYRMVVKFITEKNFQQHYRVIGWLIIVLGVVYFFLPER